MSRGPPEDPGLPDITEWLVRLSAGEAEARDHLLPAVYGELRAIAHRRLGVSERGLDTTELVHEAYLKLFDRTRLSLNDRRHFFAVAATAMRQILVDRARAFARKKRGSGAVRVDLDAANLPTEDRVETILSLDGALRRLSEVDARLARVVELRFFGGLSVEETAEVLEVDPRTVKRDWRKARALLYGMLGGEA
jgi:RNA polymerase sigma factor (TIGR02999 family)